MYEEFFVKRLTELRLIKNESARNMSLAIGQNKNYINQIENGKTFPAMQTFFYICEYLGVTPKEFFDEGKENPTLLNEFIAVLSGLSEDNIRQLLGIAKTLAGK